MKLYVVGYAHLDTQWRWSYPQVIAEFLRKTMEDNFALFDKYPDYIFNFTGANRYMMMKEFYPEDFAKLKDYVARGRWFPAGSSMEEGDVNMPSGEAIIRQVLYGNEFFRREFHKASTEFMLPDCFGFQASLPSVLAHCGIKGFSTQKLTWGSAVGIPFNVGIWEGPDGHGVIAALNPTSYTSTIDDDLSHDPDWIDRLLSDGKKTGVYVDYRYFGAGDRGGAVAEDSVKWLEKSIHGGGPLTVVSATSDQMFNELTPDQIKRLPVYRGDLLLTNHSAGSLTSEAFVKRSNRKLEQLADAAERASVAADWLGAAPYPREKLFGAWRLLLGAHFHDTMAGTALPKSYEYSWNNLVLAMNAFAMVDTDAIGAIAKAMDTRGRGTTVLVYNPLSIDRADLAEATIPENISNHLEPNVTGPDGNEITSQIIDYDQHSFKILFPAHVPSVGAAAYDVRLAPAPMDVHRQRFNNGASSHSLENRHLKVDLDSNGDIASIFDKDTNRQVLSAPARLEFLYEKPQQYPAWNMDWQDRSKPPFAYVQGPAEMKLVERGPLRCTIEVVRHAQGSTFTQRISLDQDSDRLNVFSKIDWNTRTCSLEALFPLVASNPMATYESQSAAVQRGNNNPRKFEVPQQQWLDLTDRSGQFGTAILNDCKYGSDKPDDHTIRLTLLYTPGVRDAYQDQATQDLGLHEMTYSIAPHAGDFIQGDVPWQAAELNQPLQTFIVGTHEGGLGKSASIVQSDHRFVAISALKKAEEGEDYIVRLRELSGHSTDNVNISFLAPILSAQEVDGQERTIGSANVSGGTLTTGLDRFGLRAFRVRLATPSEAVRLSPPNSQVVPLPYDINAVTARDDYSGGVFDKVGRTYPAEAFPSQIDSGGILFRLGSTAPGKKNALVCRGQTLPIPPNQQRLYILASAIKDDQVARFLVKDQPQERKIQMWTGYIGQWDNRIWQGVIPALTYAWHNRFAGLTPGFIKRDPVAWFSEVVHDPSRGIEYYRFSYLFQYALDLPPGATSVTLPDNPNVRIFAASVASNVHDGAAPARPLYDTLADRSPRAASVLPGAAEVHPRLSP